MRREGGTAVDVGVAEGEAEGEDASGGGGTEEEGESAGKRWIQSAASVREVVWDTPAMLVYVSI